MNEQSKMVYWTDDVTRQLIALVRVNPGLYAKGVYKDLRARNLAWAQIGSSLDPPCSGEEAGRRFKNLRDVFARELRKLETPKPGESGFESEYHPPSERFSELLFLRDHITGRRCRRRLKTKLQQSADFTIHLPEMGSVLKTRDEEQDEHMSSMSSQHSSLASPLGSPLIIDDFTAVGEVDGSILTGGLTSTTAQALTSSVSGKAPHEVRTSKADRSYETNDEYLRQCLDTLTELAAQICESINTSPSTSQSSTIDPFAGIVSYGLGFVPEGRRVRCLIDMLKVVESYRKGVKVTILEEQ